MEKYVLFLRSFRCMLYNKKKKQGGIFLEFEELIQAAAQVLHPGEFPRISKWEAWRPHWLPIGAMCTGESASIPLAAWVFAPSTQPLPPWSPLGRTGWKRLWPSTGPNGFCPLRTVPGIPPAAGKSGHVGFGGSGNAVPVKDLLPYSWQDARNGPLPPEST